MSIKEALKSKIKGFRIKKAEKEEITDEKAEKIIKKIIVPKFRETLVTHPNVSYLSVEFQKKGTYNWSCVSKSYSHFQTEEESMVEYKTLKRAMEIAHRFGISSEKLNDWSGKDTIYFYMDIDN